MNRPPASVGHNFWFALIFSLLLGTSGMYIVVSTADTGMQLIGWLLIVVGTLFVSVNIFLRQRHR